MSRRTRQVWLVTATVSLVAVLIVLTQPESTSEVALSAPPTPTVAQPSTTDLPPTPLTTERGARGFGAEEVAVVLGVEQPQQYLTVVTRESKESLSAVPWLTSDVSYDRSLQVFSFRAPGTAEQAVYLGSDGKYVVYSEHVVGDWVWHGSEPAKAAWIERTEVGSDSVMNGAVSATWLGDSGDYLDVSVEAKPILPASQGSSVVAFYEQRVIIEDAVNEVIEVVDLEGNMLAAITDSAVASASPDGHLLLTRRQDEGEHVLVVVPADLVDGTEIGVYSRPPDWAGWSSDGSYFAIVFADVVDPSRGEIEVWTEIWTRDGHRILNESIQEAVWTGSWSSDRSSLLLANSTSEDWLRIDIDADNPSIEWIAGVMVSEFGYWVVSP